MIWSGAAVGVLLTVAMAAATFDAERAWIATEKQHALVAREYDAATRAFDALWKQNQVNGKIVRQAESVSALIERVPKSNLLAELTNRLPAGASLVDVNIENRVKLEEPAQAPTNFDMKKAVLEARRKQEMLFPAPRPEIEVAIKICGLAETDVQVAHYLSELGHSPVFTQVSLVQSEPYVARGTAKSSLRRFQIQLTVAPTDQPRPRSGETITRTALVE